MGNGAFRRPLALSLADGIVDDVLTHAEKRMRDDIAVLVIRFA